MLIGVDLLKDAVESEAAYDDALGVTAAFNRNLLVHVNRLCGSGFRLPDWVHLARFNSELSRVEMHVQARRAVRVQWLGGERHFAQGECVHTESSYKWTVAGFSCPVAKGWFQCADGVDRCRHTRAGPFRSDVGAKLKPVSRCENLTVSHSDLVQKSCGTAGVPCVRWWLGWRLAIPGGC